MPPQLRSGRPINQRPKRVLPKPLTICRCSECIVNTYCDPTLLPATVQYGSLVTANQFNAHLRREKSRVIVLQRINELPDITASVMTDLPAGPVLQGLPLIPEDSKDLPRKRQVKKTTVAGGFSGELLMIRNQLSSCSIQTFEEIFKENPLRFLASPAKYQLHESKNLELDINAIENHIYLDRVAWVDQTIPFLEIQLARNTNKFRAHDRLLARIIINQLRAESLKLMKLREAEWDHQYCVVKEADKDSGVNSSQIIDTGRFFRVPTKMMDPIVCLCYLLVAALSILSNVSINQCSLALGFLQNLTRLFLQSSTYADINKIHKIPSDIRTVISSLDIEPEYTSFTCCPRCFCTYKDGDNFETTIPEFCNYRQTDGSKFCGTRLHTQSGKTVRPVRQYLYQDLNKWLAFMYSRPEIESLMDTYPHNRTRTKDTLKDMWDGDMLREFQGLDGKPFLTAPPSEGRLIFGINMDGFGVYNQKSGGKKNSVCGIYMICLNLPPESRYKTENMFLVGIAPGPTEPSVDQVNQVIRPLVNDLVPLWSKGIFLTRTHKYPRGRLIRGALLPVICDLPAARRISGLGAHSSKHFCSECYCNLSNINNLDRKTWIPRDHHSHRHQADRWKAAPTTYAQNTLFKAHGIRWSELLRLPYWDPTKHLVIDTMHAFYLRIYHRHVRDIWGMQADIDDGDGVSFAIDLSATAMAKAQDILRSGSMLQLSALSAKTLEYLCQDHGLGVEADIDPVGALRQYRIENSWFNEEDICIDGIANHPSPSIPLHEASMDDIDALEDPTGGRPTGNTSPTIIRPRNLLPAHHDITLPGDTTDARPDTSGQPGSSIMGGGLFAFDNGPPASSLAPARPLTAEEYLEKLYKKPNRLNFASNLSKAALLSLCVRVFQKPVEALHGKVRRDLANQLISAREEVEKQPNFVPPQPRPAKGPKGSTAVLGRLTLQEIKSDMDKIRLPSCYSPAPKHPGEVSFGNFKADEWKAFCTVNLPITLTRLWGSKAKDDRFYKMLVNFMELVSATRIATLYVITQAQIQMYDRHMDTYLKGVRELYPFSRITPYQHMSLHLADQIRRFGPTHSWRCYAFERYNGIIQKIPTNRKSGEMEITMFKRFIRMQRLRSLFTEANIPNEAQSIIHTFEKSFAVNIQRDVLYQESADYITERIFQKKAASPTTQSVHSSLKKLIHKIDWKNPGPHISNRIAEVGAVERYGQLFNAENSPGRSPNNAHVMYLSSPESSWLAGVIKYIFVHERRTAEDHTITETFAIIHGYDELEATDIQHDSFRAFPVAGGRLFYNRHSAQPVLVPFRNITAHISLLILDVAFIHRQCIHALPLNK